MKIVNTNFRQHNAFQKMKGSGASSFPSGFLDLENSLQNKNEAYNTFNNSPAFTARRPDIIARTAQATLQGASDLITGFFSKKTITLDNYSRFLDKTNEYIGEGFINARVEKFKSLLGEEKAAKFLNIHDNKMEFTESSPANKLLNGILDIPRIIPDAANAALRGIKKLPIVGDLKVWDNIAKFPLLKHRADQKAAMDIFYRLKGMAEFGDNPAQIKNQIFGVPAGAAVANYVTKDERSLNRLCTGAVSTYFVGNDFYNLAMYEKNDSKEANKSANKRMGREMLRIGLSALMTYSVLSAFSSYVNKSKNLACFAIAGSAFATEVLSRLFTGTPLLPLTPKGAKRLNKKRAEKKAKAALKGNFKGNIFNKKSEAKSVSGVSAPQVNAKPELQTLQNSKTVMPSAWYNNIPAQNVPSTGAFSQFTSPYSATQFKGESTKAGGNKNDSAANDTVKKDLRADKNKPFGLKHVAGAALAALGISLLYCAARTRFQAFDKFLSETGNFLHNFRKLVSTKDMIVKDTDLKQFFEGFNGLQSEHIRRSYSSLLDVEFTKEQAEALLTKARRGVVSVDKNNPIFAKAFIRTAEEVDAVGPERMSERITLDMKRFGTTKQCRYETAELAGGRFFDSIKADDVPDFVETRKTPKEIHHMLTGRPAPHVEFNFDGTEHSRGAVSSAITTSNFRKIMDRKNNEPFHTHQKFKNIKFTFDLKNPSVVRDGVPYYKMQNAVFNFGKIEETRLKIVIDAFEHPIKYAKMVFTLPLKLFRKVTGIEALKPTKEEKVQSEVKRMLPDLGEFYRDCFPMYKKYKKGRITQEEFSKYIESVNMKPFSAETTARYSPTALASLSRNFVTLISSYFFINDFRNEVLLQSDGENKEKAHEVTKERIAHKASNFVLNKFFMEVFNNTFNKQYLSSLVGATAVAAATELTNESSVRASIGVPLKRMHSREEIDEFEQKHLEQTGIKGAYYRFMARLTGKKMLSEKAEK